MLKINLKTFGLGFLLMKASKYDLAIVGAGITGTSLLYVLGRHTNIKSIALIEKYGGAARVNSHHTRNSQTLHFGDIETNYTLEKAKKVKEASEMTARYVEKHGSHLFKKLPKMVLAVGDAEVEELEKRYGEFKELFPNLKKIGRAEIAKIEPNVVKGRDANEKILALYSKEGYAVNYGKLSASFLEQSVKTGKRIDVFYNTKVKEIKKEAGGYAIHGGARSFKADVVVLAAGGHSLLFAHSMGYGKDYTLLPVAGSFFYSSKALNGKVYTLQIKKLPFAAVHGDADVDNPNITRFGPTAKVLLMLERGKYSTIVDFFKVFKFRLNALHSFAKILSDKDILLYVLKNMIYDVPVIGKLTFMKQVRKIVPSIKYGELNYGKGLGGIRPQIVNINERKLVMGEAKIIGDNIIFDITPSPGASVCIKNAENNAKKVIEFLGKNYRFYETKFRKDCYQIMVR